MVMNIARKALVYFASATLTILLLLTATSVIVAMIITPTRLKSWLESSRVYDTVVESILSSTSELKTNEKQGEQNLLREPAVQKAAKEAFNPQLLQKSSENLIDGVFVWLEGDSEKPNFSIDLTEAKKSFANGIGSYAKERYESLPACKSGQFPDKKDDILTIKCRIPGYNVNSDVNKLIKEIESSKELLGDPVITADTLTQANKQQQTKDVFEQLSFMPNLYQFAKLAPFIWGALAIGALAIMVFMSSERHRGLKRAGISMLIASGLIFISVLLSAKSIKSLETQSDANASSSKLAQQTAISLVKEASSDIVPVNTIFGSIYAVAGAGLLIAASRVKSGPTDYVKRTKGDLAEEVTAPKSSEVKEQKEPKDKPSS